MTPFRWRGGRARIDLPEGGDQAPKISEDERAVYTLLRDVARDHKDRMTRRMSVQMERLALAERKAIGRIREEATRLAIDKRTEIRRQMVMEYLKAGKRINAADMVDIEAVVDFILPIPAPPPVVVVEPAATDPGTPDQPAAG